MEPIKPYEVSQLRLSAKEIALNQTRGWYRVVAKFFDLFLLVLFFIYVTLPSLKHCLGPIIDNNYLLFYGSGYLLFVLALVKYETLLIYFTGTTIGKRLFKISVTEKSGKPIGFYQSLQRAYHSLADGLTFFIPPFIILSIFGSFSNIKYQSETRYDFHLETRVNVKRGLLYDF